MPKIIRFVRFNCMHKVLFGFVLTLLGLALPALADPKAYDLVKYRGSAAGVVIAFDFADGYPEASKVRVTEKGKRTIFLLDNSGMMRFVPEKQKEPNGGRGLTLKMSPDDAAPERVEGTYHNGARTVRFALKKQ